MRAWEFLEPLQGGAKELYEAGKDDSFELESDFFKKDLSSAPINLKSLDQDLPFMEVIPDKHYELISELEEGKVFFIKFGKHQGKFFRVDGEQATQLKKNYISYTTGISTDNIRNDKTIARILNSTVGGVVAMVENISQNDQLVVKRHSDILPNDVLEGTQLDYTNDNLTAFVERIKVETPISPDIGDDDDVIRSGDKIHVNVNELIPNYIQKGKNKPNVDISRYSEFLFAVALGARFTVEHREQKLNEMFSYILTELVLDANEKSNPQSSKRKRKKTRYNLVLEAEDVSILYNVFIYGSEADKKEDDWYRKMKLNVRIKFPMSYFDLLVPVIASGNYNELPFFADKTMKCIATVENSDYVDEIIRTIIKGDKSKVAAVQVLAETTEASGTKADVNIDVDDGGKVQTFRFGFSIKAGANKVHSHTSNANGLQMLNLYAALFADGAVKEKYERLEGSTGLRVTKDTQTKFTDRLRKENETLAKLLDEWKKKSNDSEGFEYDDREQLVFKMNKEIADWANDRLNDDRTKSQVVNNLINAIDYMSTLGEDDTFMLHFEHDPKQDRFDKIQQTGQSGVSANTDLYSFLDFGNTSLNKYKTFDNDRATSEFHPSKKQFMQRNIQIQATTGQGAKGRPVLRIVADDPDKGGNVGAIFHIYYRKNRENEGSKKLSYEEMNGINITAELTNAGRRIFERESLKYDEFLKKTDRELAKYSFIKQLEGDEYSDEMAQVAISQKRREGMSQEKKIKDTPEYSKYLNMGNTVPYVDISPDEVMNYLIQRKNVEDYFFQHHITEPHQTTGTNKIAYWTLNNETRSYPGTDEQGRTKPKKAGRAVPTINTQLNTEGKPKFPESNSAKLLTHQFDDDLTHNFFDHPEYLVGALEDEVWNGFGWKSTGIGGAFDSLTNQQLEKVIHMANVYADNDKNGLFKEHMTRRKKETSKPTKDSKMISWPPSDLT